MLSLAGWFRITIARLVATVAQCTSQGPHAHIGRAVVKKALRGRPGAAAGGHYVIDQNKAQSAHWALTLKGLAQVALPLPAGKPLLAGSGPLAHQGRQYRALPISSQQVGKVGALVEAAAPPPSPVDRQWAQGIGIHPWQGSFCQ